MPFQGAVCNILTCPQPIRINTTDPTSLSSTTHPNNVLHSTSKESNNPSDGTEKKSALRLVVLLQENLQQDHHFRPSLPPYNSESEVRAAKMANRHAQQ